MALPQLSKATAQLPCSVVILSAGNRRSQGAMTATAMYVSEKPPLLVVSVSKAFATYQLIEKSEAFAVNIIADDQVDLAKQFGRVHGFSVDKFSEFGIVTEPATKIAAPLIGGCFACIECKVQTALWDVDGNHAIYVAKPVAFKMNEARKPMVWLNHRYFRVGTECRL